MIWRTIPPVTFEVWRSQMQDAKSPFVSELSESFTAAGKYSALALSLMRRESQYGTDFNLNKPSNRNAANLRPPLKPDGTREPGDYMGFTTWAAGVKALIERITSPTYGGGIYARTVTVADLIAVFAPPTDSNDTPGYVRDVEALVTRWTGFSTAVEQPKKQELPVAEKIVFGRVPKPANIIDKFVSKPEGNGWNNAGPRDKLLAIVLHAVKGYAWTTGSYFGNPNEAHGYNALTDWGICGAIDAAVFGADKDGLIMDWNDPDDRGYYRRPWASGGDGSAAISGDAVAWVNRYGIPAINTYGEAVELSLLDNNDPVSAKMLESAINLIAWRVDSKGEIPYSQWPKNNDGVHMLLSHFEMGKTSCHIPDAIFLLIINGVRDRLKRYQVVQVQPIPTTLPPPEPTPEPEPKPVFPPGMTLQLARRLYGSITVPWAAQPFGFDLTRRECRIWLQRIWDQLKPGERFTEANCPAITDAIRRGNGDRVYRYSDGSAIEIAA